MEASRAPSDSASTFLAYAARGRTSWWRYPLAVLLALFVTAVVGMVAMLAVQLGGVSLQDLGAWAQDSRRPVAFFLINGALFGLFILGFAAASRLVHGKGFGDLIGAWSWCDYGLGMLFWIAASVVVLLVDFAIAPGAFRFTGTDTTLKMAAAALVGLAVQTFAEEFVFRGYLTQGLLLALRRPLPASLVSGLIFGAVHIPNGAPHAVSASVFGVVLALIAIRTGGIAFTSGLHLANNLFGAVVVVSANDVFRGSPALLTQNTPHLMWWDVGLGSGLLILLAVVMARKRPVMVNNI